MTRLKFYEVSDQKYPKENEMYIDTQAHITAIVNKLQRHFKIYGFGGGPITVNFIKNKSGGCANTYSIDLPWNLNIGADLVMIVEEVGHIWHRIKFPNTHRHHDKKLRRLMERMMKYCIDNNCWGWSVGKGQTVPVKINPKPIKQMPTPQEVVAQKLSRVQTRIKKIQTKIKRYSTQLKTAQKQEKYYLRKMQ